MAINGMGALRGADQGLNHQIADTFAGPPPGWSNTWEAAPSYHF